MNSMERLLRYMQQLVISAHGLIVDPQTICITAHTPTHEQCVHHQPYAEQISVIGIMNAAFRNCLELVAWTYESGHLDEAESDTSVLEL